MSKTYTIVEKSQKPSGWWFVLQGKFSDMALLSFISQSGTVDTANGPAAIEVADAELRNGVLSVKLDGVNGAQVARQANLVMGA